MVESLFEKIKPQRLQTGLPESDNSFLIWLVDSDWRSVLSGIAGINLDCDKWIDEYMRSDPDGFPWNSQGWFIDTSGLMVGLLQPIGAEQAWAILRESGVYWGYVSARDYWMPMRYDIDDPYQFRSLDLSKKYFPRWVVPVAEHQTVADLMQMDVVHDW